MERFTPGMPEVFRYTLQFPLEMGIANGMQHEANAVFPFTRIPVSSTCENLRVFEEGYEPALQLPQDPGNTRQTCIDQWFLCLGSS